MPHYSPNTLPLLLPNDFLDDFSELEQLVETRFVVVNSEMDNRPSSRLSLPG